MFLDAGRGKTYQRKAPKLCREIILRESLEISEEEEEEVAGENVRARHL